MKTIIISIIGGLILFFIGGLIFVRSAVDCIVISDQCNGRLGFPIQHSAYGNYATLLQWVNVFLCILTVWLVIFIVNFLRKK